MEDKARITQLLINAGSGSEEDFNELFPVIYNQLRYIAANQLAGERRGHTLQKTALVHEVYLKLIDQTQIKWHDRAHFFGIAARAMRQILVDYARKRNAQKRGGSLQPISFEEDTLDLDNHAEELIELDDLIDKMAQFDERKSKIAEMRFFGGMSVREIAKLLDVSTRTIDRDWLKARAWLQNELKST